MSLRDGAALDERIRDAIEGVALGLQQIRTDIDENEWLEASEPLLRKFASEVLVLATAEMVLTAEMLTPEWHR